MADVIKVDAGSVLKLDAGTVGYSVIPDSLWTPTELTNLEAWYDADDATTITESGGAVSQWNDKSGNSRHVVQATGADQPTTSAETLNSKNVLSWPDVGNDKRLVWDGAGSNNWQDVYVVLRYDRNGTNFVAYNSIFTSANNTGTGTGIGAMGNSGGTSLYTADTWTDVCYLDGTSVASPFVLMTDIYSSASVVSFSANSAISVDGITIGCDRDAIASGRGWSGIIAEVVVCSSQLGASDRQKVEGYLAHKWGLEANLPAGHPYKSAAPTI